MEQSNPATDILNPNQELVVEELSIPSLFKVDLVVNRDQRGTFREAWQAEKMAELGLPELGPVQWNVAENIWPGVTRGIHAEPWDKYIAPVVGQIYVAYVDLRPGPNFGQLEQFQLSPGKAVFIPKGCGNSYQTLSDYSVYSYLVTEHWRPNMVYPAIHAFDPDLNIDWPISIDHALLSEKDRALPKLREFESERI